MELTIISRSWFTETRGGAERYIYEITKHLLELGNNVITISKQRNDLQNFHIRIPTGYIPILSSSLFSTFSGLVARCLERDFTIVNGYWAEFSPLLMKDPIVLIIHDVGLFYSEWARRHRIKHALRVLLLRKTVRRAKRIVVPSTLTARDLQRYLKVSEEKIVLIPEGIDLERFKPNPIPHEGFKILHVGRFAPNKGQNILLSAFKIIKKRYPETELHFVGHLPKREYFYFSTLVKMAPPGTYFHIAVTERELVRYYNTADLCVFPSTGEEGWGLTIVEAYACQVPVICTPIFFKTGVADYTRAIKVEPEPNKMAEKIIWAIENPEFLKTIVKNGYNFAKKLSWKKTALKLIDVMLELEEENN